MTEQARPPAGPRGGIGAAAEAAAAAHLEAMGWSILARNLRVDRTELDIVALEHRPRPTLVVVEVRSRSGEDFGSPVESVDGRKVARLYVALQELRRTRQVAHGDTLPAVAEWRIDLLTLRRAHHGGRLDDPDGTAIAGWSVETHLRGLPPP